MARNDVYLNINALSPADAVVTGQQDMTAATVPELVLGDTPTFNFYFTDNTNVWPSWAGNASYSLTWALSDAVAGDFSPAATTGNATPITGGWSVILPLNSYDLVGLLNTKRVGQPYPVTNLWQQLRVTDPSGNEITRAMFWTPVRYRAISDTQNTESASPTGGRFVTVNNVNTLTTPTAAQFYAANPVPTSALGTAANGELLIGNGTGFTKSTLTAGTGITVTNGSGSITIDASGAQETLTATVKNAESVAITKGQVVYLFGATGGFASVKLAYNTSDATSAKTFGVVSSTSIAANGTGTVTCVGVVDGLNLGAYNDGDTLYLGATPGSVTATKPYAPNHLVYVGIVERANAGNGELYVRVQNGYELDEIHDVQINAPKLAGQTLIYDQTNDLWKNARLTGTTNQITVTNADAAVTLSIPTNPTLPGNLTVSGAATVTGQINGSAGYQFRGATGTTYELLRYVGGTNNPGIFATVNESTKKATIFASGSLVSGQTLGLGAEGSEALTLGAANATLSGNLTVSGGTITGGTSGLSLASGGTNQNITLTPSGTGAVVANTTSGASIFLQRAGTLIGSVVVAGVNEFALSAAAGKVTNLYANGYGAVALSIQANANLLIGTTTDSGNGKLQLATHTTSAGGIGFGTDVSLFRSAAGVLRLASTSNYAHEIVNTGGTGAAATSYSNTGGYLLVGIDSSSGGALGGGAYAGVISRDGAYSLILRTNNTTALTLDSSQNATFAAKATIYGILTTSGGNTEGVYGVSQYYGSAGSIYSTTYRHKVETTHSATPSLNKWKLSLCDGTTTGFIDSVEFTSSGAVFAGNIKTAAPSGGTAATWRLGTVASVSPTSPNRTIEVEIGGTTYYIHAKTTNN